MKPKSCIYAFLLAALCHSTCASSDALPENIVEDDYLSGTFSDLENDDEVNNGETDVTRNNGKRVLSLHGDLQSLADMLYSERNRQRNAERSAYYSELLKLGKRNQKLHLKNFAHHTEKRQYERDNFAPSTITRRHSQQLSVSDPLSTLVNMLLTEGRRRQQSESLQNRMRLLELGKRSE